MSIVGRGMNCSDELEYTRNICCAMINQAVEDAQSEKVFMCEYKNNEQDINRETAVYFLKSRTFSEMCSALGLPADKIRTRALR